MVMLLHLQSLCLCALFLDFSLLLVFKRKNYYLAIENQTVNEGDLENDKLLHSTGSLAKSNHIPEYGSTVSSINR